MDYREKLKSTAIITVKKPHLGGQQCGIPILPITVRSEELAFGITVGYYRSQYRNRELALSLFELYIDEIINK